MEKVLVPTNFLSWPRIADLLPDQKLIARELWANPFTKPEGFYELPLHPFSSSLSITASAVAEALRELERRKVVMWDDSTGEVYILDWMRFHNFKGWALENYFKSLEKIQSEKIKKAVLEKTKAAGLELPKKDVSAEKSKGSQPVPVPPPVPPPDSGTGSKTPPPPFIPPRGGCGGVLEKDPTPKPTPSSLFWEAAGKPEVLAADLLKLQKALAAATPEQSRLAGLAWANTKDPDSPTGLAIKLCRAAAQGVVTPCKVAKNEAESIKRVEAAAKYARLRARHGQKFATPNGLIAEVEGEFICLRDGSSSKVISSFSGREALTCLQHIEEGRWQPLDSRAFV